jgi:hypothetical protein
MYVSMIVTSRNVIDDTRIGGDGPTSIEAQILPLECPPQFSS